MSSRTNRPEPSEHPEELTTQQAADLLHVSHPHLNTLLNDGAIPHRGIGEHRRIRTEDLLAYKTRIDQDREAVLDDLVREAQAQGHGYPPNALEGIRDRITEAHDALRAAQEEHRALPAGDSSLDALSSVLVTLERCLRTVAHDCEIRHHQRGHTLDRLAGKIVADATASILEARLRMRSMKADDWRHHDPVRLPLIAANNALELAEYVHALEGSEA